ncbi:regulator of cell morphogenesis and NO signaling [Dysgonomonadaceae bacterium PH5-43]|nr:regulator of cell morphogenesis and NO signaling [Dysgonomonadaceae bacterium PH5-43]
MGRYKLGKYKATDSMSHLVSESYFALLVMSRFGITMGFKDKSIAEVCADYSVDTNTFLAVVNLMRNHNNISYSDTNVSIESLMDYLQSSHSYFLKYRLPEIRTKLANGLNKDQIELNEAVLSYFDKFVAEVKKHMLYENKKIFPYVKALINNDNQVKPSLLFNKQHEQIENTLSEFKEIFIKYYPAKNSNEINSVLFDIFSCEKDLASHNAVEDTLFMPIIEQLEQNRTNKL